MNEYCEFTARRNREEEEIKSVRQTLSKLTDFGLIMEGVRWLISTSDRSTPLSKALEYELYYRAPEAPSRRRVDPTHPSGFTDRDGYRLCPMCTTLCGCCRERQDAILGNQPEPPAAEKLWEGEAWVNGPQVTSANMDQSHFGGWRRIKVREVAP